MRVNRYVRQSDWLVTLVCGLALIAAGMAACVRRGFFFTGEMYLFLTVWFGLCGVLLGLVLIYMAAGGEAGIKLHWADQKWSGGSLNRARVEAQSEHRENTRELAGSIGRGSWLAIWGLLSGCVLLGLLYAIQALGSPVSAQGTLNEMLRSGFYTSFVTLALLAARTRRGRTLLAAVWHLLGITISLSALLAVCGGLPVPYAVAYTQSPGVSATGARLAGLLQYPNAFGAVMAMYLLERLFAAAYSFRLEDSQGGAGGSTQRPRTWSAQSWLSAARLLPLFPYAAALLLSESRGAWLAAAAAGAAALLLKRQLFVPLLITGGAPVAAAALLYRQLARSGLAVEPLPGLLLLAGLWAGAWLAGLWLHRRSCRAAGGYRAAILVLAAAGWTAAASAVLLWYARGSPGRHRRPPRAGCSTATPGSSRQRRPGWGAGARPGGIRTLPPSPAPTWAARFTAVTSTSC